MNKEVKEVTDSPAEQQTYILATGQATPIICVDNAMDPNVETIVLQGDGVAAADLESEVIMQIESAEDVVDESRDEEESMDDFMDIITTYQCKMCSFSSTVIQEFTSHVRSVHRKARNAQLKDEVKGDTGMEGAPEHAETVVSNTDDQLTSADKEENHAESKLQIKANEQFEGQLAEQQGIIEIGGDVVHYEIASPQVVEAMDVDTSNDTDKELYVCGTCSLGFPTIDSCKDHMVQDHNISLEVLEGQEDSAAVASSQIEKTSVGVQAQERKKPGRRKKEDRRPASPLASTIIISDEEGEEMTDDIEVYETSNKRKVRPPRGLTQLYYIGKRKSRTQVTQPYVYSCPKNQCASSFKTKEALVLHESCHISMSRKERKPWECPQCQTQFNQWKQIRMHLWRDHQLDTDLLQCPDCDYRIDTQHRLDAHTEQNHRSDRPFKCDMCKKTFKQQHQLKSHRVLHSSREWSGESGKNAEKDKWFTSKQCPVCKRVLTNSRCLSKHIEAVHVKETVFQCPHCTHTTTRKAMMLLHIRTHTGEKPFKCDLCSYRTADHNSLRRHKMRHSGARPYKCQHCSYTAIQAISLKTHMKNKHPGAQGIYCCEQCNFRTVNAQLYKNHLEDHNNGLVVAKETTQVNLQQQQQPEGQVVQIIKNGVVTGGTLVPSNMTATQMIYSAINAMQQGDQATPSPMTQTITLHLGGQDEGEVAEVGEGQVVMIQPTGEAEGMTPQAVAYNSDGSILQTLSHLSDEMMEAIAASCSGGQQVTINMEDETGDLIITTTGGEEDGKAETTIQTHQIQQNHSSEEVHQIHQIQTVGENTDEIQLSHEVQETSHVIQTSQIQENQTDQQTYSIQHISEEHIHHLQNGTEVAIVVNDQQDSTVQNIQ